MMNVFARSFDIDCTVIVSHRFEDLSAHVELEGGFVAEPGDRVQVDGPAINPPYGEVWTEHRRAKLTRVSMFERAWTRLTGDFDCLSLLEVSFSDRRTL